MTQEKTIREAIKPPRCSRTLSAPGCHSYGAEPFTIKIANSQIRKRQRGKISEKGNEKKEWALFNRTSRALPVVRAALLPTNAAVDGLFRLTQIMRRFDHVR
ncbi:hypothetical protein KCP69_02310 [Salmonella enterica subsp. enterica]|nr:hypothetical protein KCP69_02310 [Salmonella enterica subsp. enterica]